MLLATGPGGVERLLVIGCHPDDIEIGCGGTVLSLLRASPGVHVTWVVLTSDAPRAEEAQRCARAFLEGAGSTDIVIHDFPDAYLPGHYETVKNFFRSVEGRCDPDLVLTHSSSDAHQDHRLACELTWNTFRGRHILEYEIPKWEGDLGRPNLYVPLSSETAKRKVDLLLESFTSQAGKDWFDAETFLGLMRLRGVECRARFAEAFHAQKLVLGFSADGEGSPQHAVTGVHTAPHQ